MRSSERANQAFRQSADNIGRVLRRSADLGRNVVQHREGLRRKVFGSIGNRAESSIKGRGFAQRRFDQPGLGITGPREHNAGFFMLTDEDSQETPLGRTPRYFTHDLGIGRPQHQRGTNPRRVAERVDAGHIKSD
jgi:hypothetical protein